MNTSYSELAELRVLLDALCEESITPEQVQRLEQLVLGSPAAEAFYIQYLTLQADLIGHVRPSLELVAGRANRRAGTAAASATQERQPWRVRRALLYGLVGTSLAAAALFAAITLNERPDEAPAVADVSDEPSDGTVAILLQAPGAVWDEPDLQRRTGVPLSPGWLRLRSGFAQIEFYSGATVILEGPTELRLISREKAYCARGKLRATVPPQAQGFTIGSPKLDLVDRGTEFGLRVSENGKTDVHVFQGKVELYDAAARLSGQNWALTTGRSVRVEGGGQPLTIRSEPQNFLTARELATESEMELRRYHQAWLGAGDALRRDGDLVVYYRFQPESAWSRTLADEGGGGGPRARDGAVVGCSWVPGRWPGKQALEFKRVSDRVRLSVPGQFTSLTLAAWVRFDGLPNRFNSLFMTDRWDVAAPHWHVSDRGRIELGVHGEQGKPVAHYYGPPVITPDRLGDWVHLCTVHDRDGRRVTHYVDGRAVSSEALKVDLPLRIGDAEIGNWSPGGYRDKYPVRHLAGCMDEFMLFGRALNGAEVERLFEQGRPPS